MLSSSSTMTIFFPSMFNLNRGRSSDKNCMICAKSEGPIFRGEEAWAAGGGSS
jgi:hypothetical protein